MPADNRLRTFFRQLVSGIARNLPRSNRERAVPENEAQNLLARYMPAFERDVRLFTERLVKGEWKPVQWRDNVETSMRNLYLTAAIAGAGHVGRLMPEVLQDVSDKLNRQRPFLNKFAAEVERMEPGQRNLDKLTSRLLRYGRPAQEMVQRGLDRTYGRPALPFMPKDGTTLCLDNCYCDWQWVDVNPERGDWDVWWKLDAVPGRDEEHCGTCLTRAVVFSQARPIQIREGRIVTNVNVPGVRARR